MVLSLRFKTERSFLQQERPLNGTIQFLPNRPLVFTCGPFSPSVGLFKAHLKANTTISSSLFSNSLRLYISPHHFLVLGPLHILSLPYRLSPPYLHLSPRPGVPATYLLLFTPLASFTLAFFPTTTLPRDKKHLEFSPVLWFLFWIFFGGVVSTFWSSISITSPHFVFAKYVMLLDLTDRSLGLTLV